MENKDQNNAVSSGDAPRGASLEYGVVKEPPPDPDALSLEPTVPLISQEQQPKGEANLFLRFVRRIGLFMLLFLFIIGAVVVLVVMRRGGEERANTTGSNFGTVNIPLDEILSGKDLSLAGTANVTINGPLQLNGPLVLAPSLQPTGARPGQIYFDQGTNQLAYFNGEGFVFLTSPPPGGVQSLGGATGQLTLGPGMGLTGNQLNNTGVLTVQGQNGNVTLTAGPGIVINGTTFSNSGVVSIAAGSPRITVVNDGSGNITLDVVGAGTGTVTSSGGATAGTIPVFTSSQNIESSIITQSGLTVTITGDLSVITGGLSLSNALTVSNGGTGATSFANNGVLIGNGTAPISAVAAGGAGLCLISTAGAPTWAACPGGSGVTTLNGLAGALTIANASAAGSTITIDDASTTNKGIASFNATNFNVSGGAVNTAQNINTTATPTFTGVNTNTITPSGALTVGVSAQTALLQGSTTTITSNGVGNNIVLNSAATIELQDDTNVTGSVAVSGDLAVNGGDITSAGALNITPGGALTIGASSQALTLQGGPTSTFRATSGANTTIVGFTTPIANTTLNFPALAAGTYTICTTSGNCAGAAATLQSAYDNSTSPEIVLDATRGALTIRDNATPLGGNLLEVQNNAGSTTYLAVTAAGVAVTGTATVSGDINTTSGTLQTNGTTRVDNSGNLINIGSVTASGNAAFQGGTATLGTNAQAGSLVLHDGSSNTGTLQVAALGQNTVYTLPDPGVGSATICLTTGNCAGSGGGVTTPGGTTNRVAKFTGSQSLGDSSISDDGTDVMVSVDVIIQGGDLTLGTAAQGASIVLNDGTGQTTTLQAGDSTGNLTFILPNTTGTANQCLKQSGVGNQLVWQDCDGGSGGSSATLQTAYNNSSNPEITLNSSVGGLTIRDNSTPLGTNLFEIQNNAGSTTYLAVTVSGVSVTGTATASGNINTTGGSIQTNGTTRVDNTGNLVNIGNITGSGAITIASVGVGNDITIDGADQFIVQDASVFNALSTFNANIDIGANDLVGTTGDINLTNFDVDGATGNVTAGTINGQTISNAANFTGTVAVASNATVGGDIAVNGGDITSTGALNITPSGTLTVGSTTQQLILQGNASAQLTATGGGFTTTVGFTGTPVGNVTYNFDRASTAGTYSICTSIGNCAGTGGGVTTPGGTVGVLAKFTGAQTLADSLLSESGSVVTVNGNLNLTSGNQFQVNGTQISSADLSNDANLAKLSASQTFTGNTVAFQNAANSTNAFNIQNSAGTRIMTADTSNGQIILGTGSSLDGRLVFNNMSNNNTVAILPGTPTANRTLTLPDASGVICTDSGNCAGAGATLQTAYNFSVGGTTPKIKVNSTLGGVDIQDADTPIAANLLNIRQSNASGLGAVMFGVGNTGQVTMQNSANSISALRLLTAGGTAVLTGDTTNGQIILGQSTTLTGTLVFNNSTNTNTITLTSAAASSPQTITLPNATGTVCLTSGNCAGVGGTGDILQGGNSFGTAVTLGTNDAFALNLETSGTTRLTVAADGSNVTLATNTDFILQGAAAYISNPQTQTGSEAFGQGATVGGAQAVAVGNGANAACDNTVAIGYAATIINCGTGGVAIGHSVSTNPGSVAIGNSAGAGNNGIAIGNGTTGSGTSVGIGFSVSAGTRSVAIGDDVTTGADSVAIGHNALANSNRSIAIGRGATTTAVNQLVIGGSTTSTGYITQAYFGSGVTDATPQGVTLNATGGSGTNIAGADLNIAGGRGTGSATGGSINLQVSSAGSTGTTLNTLSTVATFGATSIQLQRSTNVAGNFTVAGTGSTTTATIQGSIAFGSSDLILDLQRNGGTTVARVTNDGHIASGNSSLAGRIIIADGSTAFGNIVTTNLTTDRTYTLPDATGTLCLQGSSSCGFVTGSGVAFVQGGNTFGATGQLGTTDNFGLNILTNGNTVASFLTNGAANFRNSANSTQAFDVEDSSGNNIFTVNTTNSRVGINLGGSNVPTLNGSGLEIQGGLRLSGGGSGSLTDQFTTPLGVGINTKINIPIYNPGSGNTTIATGLTSTADNNATAIAVFDARTNSNHWPTIAVYSPDESRLAGITWAGSNTEARFTTHNATGNTGGVKLQSGETAGTTTTSGAVAVGSGNGVGTNTSSGNVGIDSGSATGTGTTGNINIGTVNSTLITIGRAGMSAVLQSNVAMNGNTTIGDSGSDTLTLTATIQGASPMVFEGATVDANDLTLAVANPTAARTITLPDATGTVCLQNSASCGFLTGSASDYIQNQTASSQTASFRISGTGEIGTSLTVPTVQAPAATALTLTGNAASTWSTTSGNLTVQAAGTSSLILQTAGAGTVALGDQNTTTINIGRGASLTRTINVGNVGTNTITMGSTTTTSTTTIQGGTGATAIALTTGTNGSINATTSGTGNINLITAASVIARSSTNSTTAFQVQNSSNTALLRVNTTATNTGTYILGTGTGNGGGRLFIGDTNVYIGEEGTTDTDGMVLHAEAYSVQNIFGDELIGMNGYNGSYQFNIMNNDFGGMIVNESTGDQVFAAWGIGTAGNPGGVSVGNDFLDGQADLFFLDKAGFGAADPDPQAYYDMSGTMYYSADLGAFRCYEGGNSDGTEANNDFGGQWKDCLGVPKPNSRRWTYITHPGGTGTSFDANGDAVTATASASTGVVASTSDPSVVQYSTTATSGNAAHIVGNANYNSSGSPTYQSYVKIPTTTSVRIWAGLTAVAPATMMGSATPAGNYAAFRYDTSAGDGGYQCVVSNSGGGAPTVVGSGQGINANGHKLEVSIYSGARAIFKIDGQIVCSISTTTGDLPAASTMLNYINGATTLTTAARSIQVGWVYVESDK